MSGRDTETGEVRHLTPVIAYLRVSTEEQGRSGLGLRAQKAAVRRAAEYFGWDVVDYITDEASGKSLDRPGIQRALGLLEDGGPRVLVASKLDRIARSALDFLTLVDRATKEGWSLIVLDVGGEHLDMTTPMGRFTATILAGVAELERGLISQRTKEALREAKAKGTKIGRLPYGYERDDKGRLVQKSGVSNPHYVIQRIKDMRDGGASYRTIAAELTRDGVPTARGKKNWHPTSVRSVLLTATGQDQDHEQ